MGFIDAKNGRVFANELHVSGNVTGYSLTHSRAYGETTVLTDDGCRYIPGLLGGGLGLKGLFDSAAGSLYNEAISAVGVDNGLLVTAMPDATTIGQPAFIAVCDLSGLKIDATLSAAVPVEVTGDPDDGIDWGVGLHAFGAETADVNGASVDNAASSAAGGVASLHVTAYTGLTSAVLKVQHSTDNAAWSDLVTFTTVTGVTFERKTAAGTVNRYVRGFLDVTGTGSITYVMAFARR